MNVSDYLMNKTASVIKEAGIKQHIKIFEALAKNPEYWRQKNLFGQNTENFINEVTRDNSLLEDSITDMRNKLNQSRRGVKPLDEATNHKNDFFIENHLGSNIREPLENKLQRTQNEMVNIVKKRNKNRLLKDPFNESFRNFNPDNAKDYRSLSEITHDAKSNFDRGINDKYNQLAHHNGYVNEEQSKLLKKVDPRIIDNYTKEYNDRLREINRKII